MPKKVSFSDEHSSLDEVHAYYSNSQKSLNYYYDTQRTDSHFLEIFYAKTLSEINAELRKRQETLQRMCVLEILTMIEARLRIDYLVRCQRKKKDNLSKRFRDLYKSKKNKASLEDDIMKIWKSNSSYNKKMMDDLGQALKYRHWLAHGRYWYIKIRNNQSKTWNGYQEVYLLALNIFNNTDLYEN